MSYVSSFSILSKELKSVNFFRMYVYSIYPTSWGKLGIQQIASVIHTGYTTYQFNSCAGKIEFIILVLKKKLNKKLNKIDWISLFKMFYHRWACSWKTSSPLRFGSGGSTLPIISRNSMFSMSTWSGKPNAQPLGDLCVWYLTKFILCRSIINSFYLTQKYQFTILNN